SVFLCLWVLVFLIQGRLLQGPTPATLVITGTVRDQSGAAFLGAQVDLLKDGQQQRTTTTDTSGAFRIDRLQPGNYEVRTYKEGFKTDITKVTVGNRSPGRLRIVLSIENLNQQITVSGDNPEVSTDPSENRDVAAVDRQALDDLPIFDQDVVATMYRFLYSRAFGTYSVALIVHGIQGGGDQVESAVEQANHL